MDFQLTPREAALRLEARAFAQEVVQPGAGARDREGSFPRAVIQQAAGRGYLGLLVPAEQGGLGVGNLGQCLVLEEVARVDASTHVTLSVHNSLVTAPLLEYGSEEIRKRYLPKLVSGEWLGAYALSEPHSGSDAAALATTAVRDGNEFVLNGSKMWITTGNQAGLIVVFARTDPDVPKNCGLSAFAVERASPGLSVGKKENKLGLRASETVQLFLEDVRVPARNLLGKLNEGFRYALHYLNGGRIGVAIQSVGLAQGAFDFCQAAFSCRAEGEVRYRSQDENFRLAEMATSIEAARLLAWRAAWLRDRGKDHIREASMAKLLASVSCNRVCQQALALLGAKGWQAGPLERFFRDARVTEIYEGTTEIQKIVIARQLWNGG